MNPLDALAKLGLGLIHEGKVQGWCRLTASCLVSAFVTFFGTFGALLEVGSSFEKALGIASLAMACVVIALWLRSPMTKGIPILYPGKIEAARLQQLAEDGTVYNPNEQKGGTVRG